MWDDEGEVKVSGNTCKRGQLYGVQEFTAPMRTVTSSVPVVHGRQAMCSVKTAQPVPKERVQDVLRAIRGLSVKAPVAVGDVLLEDAAGTGAQVVATRRVEDRRK